MKQVFPGRGESALAAATTRYNPLMQIGPTSTTISYMIAAGAGTLGDWIFELDAAPGLTFTHTITVVKNGVDQFSVTISNLDTTASSGATVSIVAEDRLHLRYDGGAVGAGGATVYYSFSFTGTTAGESLLTGGSGGGVLNVTNNRYGPLYGHNAMQSSEVNARQCIPTPGTIKALYVRISSDPGTAGVDAYSFTLMVNGAASALTCTITADNVTGQDTTNTVTVAAGDLVSVEIVPINAPSTAPRAAWGMVFVADVDGESLILGGGPSDPSATATHYNSLGGFAAAWGASEAAHDTVLNVCTLRKFAVATQNAPGSGNNFVFTVRDEHANTALAVTIADTDTYELDTDSISVPVWEKMTVQSVPTSTPTTGNIAWGCVCYISPGVTRRVMLIS